MLSALPKMEFTVLELGNVDGNLTGIFLGNFLNLGKLFSDCFIGQNLLVKLLCIFRIAVQEIYNGFLYLFNNGHSYFCVAQFVLCLAFKNRSLNLYCNSTYNSFSYILRSPVLLKELVNAFQNSFLEGCLVSSSVRCVLAVYVGEIVFSGILSCMGKCKFQGLGLVVNH